MAVSYLKAHGYLIEAQNWRGQRYELDIVASKGDCLVFVEVKSSTGGIYGPPELRVTRTKQQRLGAAAAEYLAATRPPFKDFRFDVIAIVWPQDRSPQITHLESAFIISED